MRMKNGTIRNQGGGRLIHGQAFSGQERDGFYHRLPLKAKDNVRRAVWKRSKCSSGTSLVFSTDAEKIVIRYQVTRDLAMHNMSATGVSGVDLYTYDRKVCKVVKEDMLAMAEKLQEQLES